MIRKGVMRLLSIVLLFAMVMSCGITKAYAATPMVITNFRHGTGVTATINDSNIKNEITRVPLFNQGDYPSVPYGSYGTIASHGCGITSVAMVATYMKNEFYSPVDLAKRFGHYNTPNGSYWTLFKNTAEILGIPFQEQTSSWAKAEKALENGQIVVSLQSGGIFTNGGHFIVLTGITDDGRVMVNDPNGHNWAKNAEMVEGFANGFTPGQITANGGPYWIYGVKE